MIEKSCFFIAWWNYPLYKEKHANLVQKKKKKKEENQSPMCDFIHLFGEMFILLVASPFPFDKL